MLKIDNIKKEIINKIFNNKSSIIRYSDIILIGNNMSGKSYLIKEIIKEKLSENNIYFIDSVNRIIPNSNPMGLFNTIKLSDILENRLKDDIFNKKDVISTTTTNTLILNELLENFKNYKTIIENYFGYEFEIITEYTEFKNKIYKYKLNNELYSELSNGIQAILRILVEYKYAMEQNCKLIVIDEIESHLDSENAKKILSYLKGLDNSISLLCSTHSQTIIANAKDFSIVKINNDSTCEIYDGNDVDDINSINKLLFSPNKNEEKEKIDSVLANYIRMLATGYKLTKKDIEDIEEIEKINNLTIKQNVLKKQIIDWNK